MALPPQRLGGQGENVLVTRWGGRIPHQMGIHPSDVADGGCGRRGCRQTGACCG